MQKSYFGIDFGTTNTAVVQLRVDEYGTITEYCSEDNMPFSSLLAMNKKDGTILFGRRVRDKRRQLSRDYHIFSSFKSDLGKPDVVYNVCNKKYTPTDITALFLRSIKNYIAETMELDIDQATFAIPIDFSPLQRAELRKAAKAAGIKVSKFISEPTAAYMRNIDLVKGFSRVAVFDWGGGTLDISILEIEKDTLKELAVNGKKLGGDDIDRILAKRIHADIAAKSSIGDYDNISDKDKDLIIRECERAKIVLSNDDFHRIPLIDYVVPGVIRVPLELDRFKEIIQPQVDAAIETLYETIKKARISVAQLDGIIMVGGSCEMQSIQEIMSELFERKNIKVIYPGKKQWSVAVGAAMIETSNTNYCLNQSLGVILADDNDTFYPIIEKGNPIPCETNEIRFGVVEETTDAHFIITDEEKNTLKIANVPVKGFTTEGIALNAQIDEDMIAHISLQSTHMAKKQKIEIHKLEFYYDLTNVKQANENVIHKKIADSKDNDTNTCSFFGCSEIAVRGGYCAHHYSWEFADSK